MSGLVRPIVKRKRQEFLEVLYNERACLLSMTVSKDPPIWSCINGYLHRLSLRESASSSVFFYDSQGNAQVLRKVLPCSQKLPLSNIVRRMNPLHIVTFCFTLPSRCTFPFSFFSEKFWIDFLFPPYALCDPPNSYLFSIKH
jgi:hypothetical protein